mmetsp:Transcript_14631/g.40085  ORF Transcript_14631/g.40085 Transcript_14631/m.40085 type:complete len:253 (-) Transcript_14631:30-788(-)
MKLMRKQGATVAPTNTFHLSKHPHLKDSVQVQTSEKHDYVNDSEPHEEHPHLQDFLKPHHTTHVKRESSENSLGNEHLNSIQCAHETVMIPSEPHPRPSLPRPKKTSLHVPDCESRRASNKTESRRSIKFAEVTLREYGMILGDHPGCRSGPPVTLEWDYVEYEPLSVDEYEIHHSLRRPLRNLILQADTRKKMFQALGYSALDFKKAMREVNRRKNERFWTNEKPVALAALEAGIESAARKVKRFIENGRK